MTDVFRLSRSLSSKQKSNLSVQPATNPQGDIITSTEEQQECWADFLEKKFAARDNEPDVVLNESDSTETVPDPIIDEVVASVSCQKPDKATGPDGVPIEQYKHSRSALNELFNVLLAIWRSEEIPDSFVLADMLMHYKKKDNNIRSNYRALGLLNHGYKTFAKLLLTRILPYVTPKLSDMPAGFRKDRGCRDNILILTSAIDYLLRTAEDSARSQGILTYIDFTAAFDSILHSYLLNALKSYGVPLKYCRLVKAIYESAQVRVRIQEKSGAKSYSRNISIRRGVIQGDIPSPICFLIALDKLLKDHGDIERGLKVGDSLLLSDLEFADDAALSNEDTTTSTNRLTHLDRYAKKETGMIISIPKTKVQHIRKRPVVSETTETDIENLPTDKAFKHRCDKCGMTYPSKHGLSVHQGRWCKKIMNARKPSRKGTVADSVITRYKVEQF